MNRAPVDLLGGLLADVEALAGAACELAPVDFVDVDQAAAEYLIRTWCLACPAADRCREVGDRLAPHAFGTVMGGRYFPARALESVPVLTRRTPPNDLSGHPAA
jgi:hypothetical protein